MVERATHSLCPPRSPVQITAKALADEHAAQVLGHLKLARLEHGLLINFGSYKFELRKYVWSQTVARQP